MVVPCHHLLNTSLTQTSVFQSVNCEPKKGYSHFKEQLTCAIRSDYYTPAIGVGIGAKYIKLVYADVYDADTHIEKGRALVMIPNRSPDFVLIPFPMYCGNVSS